MNTKKINIKPLPANLEHWDEPKDCNLIPIQTTNPFIKAGNDHYQETIQLDFT